MGETLSILASMYGLLDPHRAEQSIVTSCHILCCSASHMLCQAANAPWRHYLSADLAIADNDCGLLTKPRRGTSVIRLNHISSYTTYLLPIIDIYLSYIHRATYNSQANKELSQPASSLRLQPTTPATIATQKLRSK